MASTVVEMPKRETMSHPCNISCKIVFSESPRAEERTVELLRWLLELADSDEGDDE